MDYVLVDDSVAGVGGTALTLEGLIEPVKDKVIQIPTSKLRVSDIVSNWGKTWVFGNIHALTNDSAEVLLHALSMVRFFKIEFDYGYCLYRGRIPHLLLGGSECDCETNPKAAIYQEIYNLIRHRSVGNFYMSQEQMEFHIEDLNLESSKCHILSSCFSSSFHLALKTLNTSKKNKKYAIIDGQGGWHSTAKGVPDAIDFAKQHNIPFDLLKTESQEELMILLSKYKGLIFHPIIHDTCPRITIEAKLLNLDLKINERCQHISEEWWSYPNDKMQQYLKSRPDFLWDSISAMSNEN